jgi:hypothetical protein
MAKKLEKGYTGCCFLTCFTLNEIVKLQDDPASIQHMGTPILEGMRVGKILGYGGSRMVATRVKITGVHPPDPYRRRFLDLVAVDLERAHQEALLASEAESI